VTRPLDDYRAKRDPARTPEPVPPPGPLPTGRGDTFVIQEHHATALHWDFRLERAGVLVSWAVPKGLPLDPKTNHLAVHTEDHPLSYAAFAGAIPAGEYGGGRVSIWDRGTYVAEKWTDREVKIVLTGSRVSGRYVLFATGGKNWMIHRMDPPPTPDWQPLPDLVRPMLAVAGPLPTPEEDPGWGYELKWDGVRATVYVEGGRPRALSRNDRDVTASYPELRALAASLGTRQVVLDGEIVAVDERGRVSFGVLQSRMHVTKPADARRLAAQVPATFVAFDVVHLDGADTTGLPYTERRALLESLALAGPAWQTGPSFRGGGADVLAGSLAQGLEGIVAKRLDSTYQPGRRSESWRKIKNLRTQEVVIGGWKPGHGRRADTIGSLLLGVQDAAGLEYAGHVGTGFTDRALRELATQLRPLRRPTSPFAGELPRPDARDAIWVVPTLVGEVEFGEWTRDGRLRHPSWRGLRADKDPTAVRREPSPDPGRPQ
jgi:bifunctional non-homologous end joining protein LigD